MFHGGWLVVAVSPQLENVAGGREELESLTEVLARPAATLCVLAPRLTSMGWAAVRGPVTEALRYPDLLTLLVPAGPTSPVSGRSDGPIHSFVGPASLLRDSTTDENAPGLELELLCLSAVRPLLAGPVGNGTVAAAGIVVRECPEQADGLARWVPGGKPPVKRGPLAVVMAHRDSLDNLRAALASLVTTDPAPDAIRVGLDVDDVEEYRPLVDLYPGVQFFACTNPPAGPYVIRQALAYTATERFIAFHDSDDLSCRDRFHWLRAEMARHGRGLVGSHELRFDEEDRELRGARFPLDVNAALLLEPKHPQLHPTSMITSTDFRRSGGFSTDCIFGNDSQFLLRAHFHMPVRNVDRFLYLRRDRPDSLTNAPETGMANPHRIARNLTWRSDFESIKAGRLRLEDSSLLAVAGRGAPWKLLPLRPTDRC